jgi:hypothetical protein
MMTDVIAGNDVDECLALFHVICRKKGLAVVFDGSAGKIKIYQKETSRWRVLARQDRLFSIFDPDVDGRDAEENARRWFMAATILSEEMKRRGIQVKIAANDFCVFTKVIEETYTPFGVVLEAYNRGVVSLEFAARQSGMSEENFLRIAEEANNEAR